MVWIDRKNARMRKPSHMDTWRGENWSTSMSDVAQVQIILRSIYSHCTTLCEFTEQAGHVRSSSPALHTKPNRCRQLKHLCCKILVATNNPNCIIAPNRDRLCRDVKVSLPYNLTTVRHSISLLFIIKWWLKSYFTSLQDLDLKRHFLIIMKPEVANQ